MDAACEKPGRRPELGGLRKRGFQPSHRLWRLLRERDASQLIDIGGHESEQVSIAHTEDDEIRPCAR